MNRDERLRNFAQEKETEVKKKLNAIKTDLENKKTVCEVLLGQQRDISSEGELASLNEGKDETYYSNLATILEVYQNVLDYMERYATILMNDIVWGNQFYVQDESRSYEYYEAKVEECYNGVMNKFQETCPKIIHFCKILIDIADSDRTEELGQHGNAFVMVNLFCKFVIPLDKFVKILDQAKENVQMREAVSTNPNDNSSDSARNGLKERARELIDLDYQIRNENGPLLDALINGQTVSDELKNKVYGFMKCYLKIGASEKFLFVQLRLFSGDSLDDDVSSEELSSFREEINNLKNEVWKFFGVIVEAIHYRLNSSQNH